MTREEFARLICTKMGWVPSTQVLDCLVAWMSVENTQAAWNPFATERAETGATDFNPAGVKDYTSVDEGIQAFFDTITNGLYAMIINALALQAPATVSAAAIDSSPWGSHGVVAMVATVEADRTQYYTTAIGGSVTITPTPAPTPAPQPTPGFQFPEFSIAQESTKLIAVEVIQAALRDVYGYTIAIDGFFGPITEGAVKAFQRAHNLAQDGIVGQMTYVSLLSI